MYACVICFLSNFYHACIRMYVHTYNMYAHYNFTCTMFMLKHLFSPTYMYVRMYIDVFIHTYVHMYVRTYMPM